MLVTSAKTRYLPRSVLKAYKHHLLLLSLEAYEVGVDGCVSQRRKLSLREVKSLAQGHRGDKWPGEERASSAELPDQVYATKMRAERQGDSLNHLAKITTKPCPGGLREGNRALGRMSGQLCVL